MNPPYSVSSQQITAAQAVPRAASVAEKCAETAADVDRDGAFPEREFEWLREAGLLAAPLPPTLGGAGLGTEPGQTASLLEVLKHLGRGNLSVGRLYEGHVNALQLVALYGTEEQKKRYAAAARDGKLFAVWNTEGRNGVVFERQDGRRVRLQGAKIFASGAGHVDRPLITGQFQEQGWQMAVVPADEKQPVIDESWWHPMGMRASASFQIDFSGLTISKEDLLGPPDAYRQEPWFSGGAIRFAAVQLGGAEALFDLARSHLREHERTDDPHQRRRVGHMAIALEEGTGWLSRAAATADRYLGGAPSPPPDRLVTYANMMRMAIEHICLDVLEKSERSIGARGMLKPHPFERIARDLHVYLRQPAPDVALDEVGRHVLASDDKAYEIWTRAS